MKDVKDVFLGKGNHPTRESGVCAMEYAAYLAGERHGDRPAGVSPVLLDFVIPWNDALDDETRQRLRPYIVRTLGTAGDGQDEARRYLALDWLVRTHAPAFLAAAGLREHAAALERLAIIEGVEEARAALPPSAAAAAASWAASRDAQAGPQGAAFRAAAGDAAWAAAWAAAWRDAAAAALRDAAAAASRAAAWAADWDALRPTIAPLQESALELLDRLIDPNGLHDVKDEPGFSADSKPPVATQAISR